MKQKIGKYHIFPNICMILFSVFCVLPFLLIFSISISKESDILKFGYQLLPKNIDWSAYKFILSKPDELLNAYWITILTTVVGTVASVFIMALAAYPLSRNCYKWRNQVSFFIFFTMLFSGGLVPTYILITQYLNMKNTIWVLIIPNLLNAWHIILLRSFFKSVPEALFESAKIDGANEFSVFLRILIPLSKPALATIILFGVLMRWNEWYSCMLYIDDKNLYTLQYLLQKILLNVELIKKMGFMEGALRQNIAVPTETMRMAMAVLVVGPIVFVFPFFQKYFTKGIVVGAVKG